MADYPDPAPDESPILLPDEPRVEVDDETRRAEALELLLTWLSLRTVHRLEFLRWLYEQPDHGGL